MLILLSSGSQKRYRDDVLRCLAAPVGAMVQFRYNDSIVESEIKEAIRSSWGQDAIVCNLDVTTTDPDGRHPILPVRHVTIQRVWLTGSTVSVLFRVGAFALADDVASFNHAFYTSKHPPKNAHVAAETGGLWFFTAADSLGDRFRVSQKLKDWEKTAEALVAIQQFRTEPFFWTVLGLNEGSADESWADSYFRPWPDHIKCDTIYTLLIYVFRGVMKDANQQDEIERTGWAGHILLTSEPVLSSTISTDIKIDSPYDLKRWSFKLKRPTPTYSDPGRLTIGIEALDKSTLSLPAAGEVRTAEQIRRTLQGQLTGEPQWAIDLTLKVNSPWLRILGVSIPLGILLALPALVGIWQQPPSPTYHPISTSIFAVIGGYLAAIFAVFQIKKPT